MDAGLIAAVVGTFIAAAYDLRYRRIPNAVPAGMLLISFPLAFLGGYVLPWAANILLASVVFYAFWMLRAWAAGDSKLFIGIAALIPQYPPTFLPQPSYAGFFFLSVVFNLLIVYLFYTSLLILRKSQRRVFSALALGSFAALSAAAYGLGFAFAVPLLFSFMVFHIYSEASRLDLTRLVSVSELNSGDNLAERIFEEDGRILRKREGPASVSSLILRLLGGEGASSPAPYGLTEEERMRLRGLVSSGRIEDSIRVYSGTIMSPMILGSLLISVSVGDVLAALV